MLDALASLVDRSLVTVREHDGEARYGLLETVRQYALERLEASGESDPVRGRHAAFFAALAAEAEPHLTRATRPRWIARLLPELDNLREALSWTRDHAPGEHVVLVGRLWWFWFSTRHWAEGGRWLADALALPEADLPGPPRAALLFARGALLALQARADEPRPFLEEAATLARAAGDGRLEAYALNYLAMTYAGEGRAEALEPCRRAEAWFREHGDLYGLRLALLLQGSAAMGLGMLDESKRLNREGVEVARRFGLDRELSIALQNLAAVHLRAGEHAEAERLVREALEASRRDPSHYFIAVGLLFLAEAIGHRGEHLPSARLLGAAEALAETIGLTFFRQDRERLALWLPLVREAVGEAAFERARAEGRVLSAEQALTEACRGADDREAQRASVPAADPPSGREAPPDLTVGLLGSFEALVAGVPIPAETWSYAKPRELLALLVSQRDGATRDQMARMLWPEAAPSRLKNSFHVTLHHLRKALDRPGWVVQEGDRYRIAPEVAVEVDAHRFEDAAGRALAKARTWQAEGRPPAGAGAALETLEQAIGLYAGDLLGGEVGAAWAEEWRDRLRRRAVDVHVALGRACEQLGRVDDALRAFTAAVAREPLGEEAHRGLMRCWAASGERARALAHYQDLAELLRERLDVTPDPETVSLAEALRRGA
jgi:DNA-binding SARP family transcriptional activator